jgi:hypothetical protein
MSSANIVHYSRTNTNTNLLDNEEQPSVFFITNEDIARYTTVPTVTNQTTIVPQQEPDKRVQIFPARRSKIEYVPICSFLMLIVFVSLLVFLNTLTGETLINNIFQPRIDHTPHGTTPYYNGTIPMQTPTCGLPAIQPNLADEGLDILTKTKRNIEKRIINGWNAKPGSWPWMVSLRDYYSDSHFCDGFLIYSQYVLTAAHCLEKKNVNDLVIVVGIYDLNDYDDSQVYEAEKFFVHKASATIGNRQSCMFATRRHQS